MTRAEIVGFELRLILGRGAWHEKCIFRRFSIDDVTLQMYSTTLIHLGKVSKAHAPDDR